MQTFLPYPDFHASAACLDPKRLGNQVYREARTLITGGWPHHPASKMWAGYRPALALYALACLEELQARGKPYPQHFEFFRGYLTRRIVLPPWIGDERLHSSHRAALLYKNAEWYSQFGWNEKPSIPNAKGSLPYHWPVT